MPTRICAYCGNRYAKGEGGRDHVAPACLYPEGPSNSRVPRITVPACKPCNSGWSDDEPHFKNTMILASAANPCAVEVWRSSTRRSFRSVDGQRRLWDLRERMKPVDLNGEQRYMIYPAEDERVLRVVRKTVRGLCHHHRFGTSLTDQEVWVDVLRFEIPPEFMEGYSAPKVTDPLVFRYKHYRLAEDSAHSSWLLTYYERCTFIAVVKPELLTTSAA